MNYCALDDAFQAIGGAPSPGCATDYATKAARKEERKKAKRCKGPPAAYLDLEEKESDSWNSYPAMNPAIGMREHTPVTAPQGDSEPFVDQSMNAAMAVQACPTDTQKPAGRKKYFGASPDDDTFADYVPEQEHYQLTPDFRTAFEHAGVARAGSAAQLPTPSVNMYWKPRTVAGAQTSFIDQLPPPGGKYYKAPNQRGEISMEEVMKKMDKIFARLDDMNSTSSPEQVTSELLMFISSGIFVLFFMDLLVKKGSTLRF